MWPTFVVFFLFILLPFDIDSMKTKPSVTRSWGEKISSLKLYAYTPTFFAAAIRDMPQEQLSIMIAQRPEIERMYKNDSSMNISMIIDYYATVAPVGAARSREGYQQFLKLLEEYDSTTRMEITEFFEELAEALFTSTQYNTAYALLHYLHLRNGLGRSRSLVRELFPVCEKMAKIKEIKEFYLKYRGHEPTSVFLLSKFMKLLKWLHFQHKL